ncbi:phage tail assembly protein [Devosia sp. RR2S18]|uniref:phage tail assembly protein n=1 Tax=Devosia rhizosphaerae TaxID=3049774 RepID=UPI0025402960|nr:phage tail assembly protein [Devosia sp. RR2S18]WIJ24993.1 phage tail assembly protein [Devosia sp. RR2S18]
MREPVTVTLTNPIDHMGQTYTELTFTREMRMKDLFVMDEHKGGSMRTAALYASMANVPFEVISELTNEDMGAAAQAVAAFSGKPSGTEAADESKTENLVDGMTP